jgi:tryptophan synthase alpha chain
VLENKIRELKAKKGLLLMPHLVLGYPSFEDNRKMIDTMIGAGAEIIEMQIPFSEPMADGPVILKANDESLKRGTSTSKCLEFAQKVCAEYPDTIFLFMTYYNILFARGVAKFVAAAKAAGIRGLIVPDLPPEEGSEYIDACAQEGVDPIFIFTPTSKPERLKHVAQYCRGMVYCVGRKGVTGMKTTMDKTLSNLIKRFRSATNLPLALGFGIQEKADIDAIRNEVDIAVIGTKILTIQQEQGIEAVGRFLKGLR